MSKYLLDKFLYTVDRDPDLVERYREDPAGTVAWWEAEMANSILNCHGAERSTWLAFTDDERRALRDARPRRAVRDGRAPVPHPDPVHRDVRARPRAAGVPDRLRRRRWSTSRCPTPTSPPDAMRAAVLHHRAGLAAVVRPSTRTPSAAPGPDARPGDRRAGRAARPAVRVGHVVLRAARRCPTCPACRVSAWSSVRGRTRRHPGVVRHARPGCAPGDGSLAELCAGRRTPTSCRWPPTVPDDARRPPSGSPASRPGWR